MVKESKRPSAVSREEALSARPSRLRAVSIEPIDDGAGIRVTVKMAPARWRRWLGGTGEVTRSYDLDALGKEVYEACDGVSTVRDLVRGFAQRHHLGVSEAEISVTQFLKTLMSRGLIAMEFDDE